MGPCPVGRQSPLCIWHCIQDTRRYRHIHSIWNFISEIEDGISFHRDVPVPPQAEAFHVFFKSPSTILPNEFNAPLQAIDVQKGMLIKSAANLNF